MEKQEKKDVAFYVKQITDVLTEEGVYNKTLDLAIESCGQIYYLKDRVFDKIKNRQPTVKEKSREDMLREKKNPAFTVFQELTEIGRKMLVELSMTARTSQATSEDDVERLTRKVSEVMNER